jgi:sec-independent protein translocase protein TatA
MGPIGMQEMVLIFLIALVLFGPKKLPELGKTIGKAITEFRRASNDLKASFEREMHNLERETEALKDNKPAATPPPQSFSDPYYDDSGYHSEPHDYAAQIPSTVSASEVPGAESQVAEVVHTETPAEVKPGVEGTVPRTEPAPQHTSTLAD